MMVKSRGMGILGKALFMEMKPVPYIAAVLARIIVLLQLAKGVPDSFNSGRYRFSGSAFLKEFNFHFFLKKLRHNFTKVIKSFQKNLL
jgi:hypothetical protein